MLLFRRALFFGLRTRTPDVVCGLPLAANATRARRRRVAAAATQAAAAKADSGSGCLGGVVIDAATAVGLENAICLAVSTPTPSGLGEVHANAILPGEPRNRSPKHHNSAKDAMRPLAGGCSIPQIWVP
mmetsp:Transcript_107159/g.207648  ORF Transcript_107159/g.207648 Transcript_107159/m.207648 type:complete len:129 (-) Transcript_107159:36-422(-)